MENSNKKSLKERFGKVNSKSSQYTESAKQQQPSKAEFNYRAQNEPANKAKVEQLDKEINKAQKYGKPAPKLTPQGMGSSAESRPTVNANQPELQKKQSLRDRMNQKLEAKKASLKKEFNSKKQNSIKERFNQAATEKSKDKSKTQMNSIKPSSNDKTIQKQEVEKKPAVKEQFNQVSRKR